MPPVAPRKQRLCFNLVGLALAAVLSFQNLGCGDDGEGQSGTVSPSRGSEVARPRLEGPVSGGTGSPFLATTTFDPGLLGYSTAEYFMSGTATAYTNLEPLGDDGKWKVGPAETAAYKTRIVVYRPIDPARFNGTVVVEWLNVSGGLDAAPDWLSGHVEMIRQGMAWVGVSAQYVGVEGGASLLGLPVTPLKTVDPGRYASLSHPGDSFSYDIFSQTAQAVRRPGDLDPLSGLKVETVLGVGESQSAFRMVTYANAIHPIADIYDGFLVHSRGNIGAPLAEEPQAVIGVPGAAPLRDDLNVPVLALEMETDLTFLGYFSARQPDSARFRLWEVAGTAHADTYTTVVGHADLGNSPDPAKLVITTTPALGFTCRKPINSGPQHYVLHAAIAALNAWVRHGTLPPTAPRLQVNAGPNPKIVRDTHGNAVGGIRTPYVDAPIAVLTGEGQTGLFCALFGNTTLFDAIKLSTLYADHAAYVAAYNQATDRAVTAGFLLPADAALMKMAAADSEVGTTN